MRNLLSLRPLLRSRDGEHSARVTNIELFFDLVFVFAITQLSSLLRHDLTLMGAVHASMLFLCVWYVWISTSWFTNWLDPERWPVRIFLLVLALVGLALSTSIPHAFDDKGWVFACAYSGMQVGRSLFMLWALGTDQPANTRNFQRITIWLGTAALFWLAGSLFAGPVRLTLWGIALTIDYLGPAFGFFVPRLGRSTTRDWDVAGSHLAERCSLFIIIALGESVLVIGETASELAGSLPRLVGFVVDFIGAAALWWIYFDTGVEAASEQISTSDDPGQLARLAYTYIHLVIVAGIIIGAAGNELLLAHPLDLEEARAGFAILGGPIVFLTGVLLFKWSARGWPPLSHMIGLALFAGLVLLATRAGDWSNLTLASASAAILVLTAVWETVSLRGPKRRAAA